MQATAPEKPRLKGFLLKSCRPRGPTFISPGQRPMVYTHLQDDSKPGKPAPVPQGR